MLPKTVSVWLRQGIFCVCVLLVGLSQESRAVLTNFSYRPMMAAGGEHALMVKSDGTVWVWGNNSHSQQFGGAVIVDPGGNDVDFNPSRVPSILGGVAVAAGSYHSLVLKYDGTVLTWGENANGQLGVGDTADKGTPVTVTNLSGVVALDGGDAFSMAV